MKIHQCNLNLMVEDLDKTIEFYRDKLDFTIDSNAPAQPPFDWVCMRHENSVLFFQTREHLSKEIPVMKDLQIGASTILYFYITGIVELFESLKDNVTIVRDLHDTFYGNREFAILDPNGYILAFSEPVNANNKH